MTELFKNKKSNFAGGGVPRVRSHLSIFLLFLSLPSLSLSSPTLFAQLMLSTDISISLLQLKFPDLLLLSLDDAQPWYAFSLLNFLGPLALLPFS